MTEKAWKVGSQAKNDKIKGHILEGEVKEKTVFSTSVRAFFVP
jgi:hypothetical protein